MKLTTLKPRLREAPRRINPNVANRITGRRRQEIRRQHFAEHPLCVHCEAQGRVAIATELDHIVPLHKGGQEADSNRQGLCHDCHLAKTAKDLKP
jgi:5-methylcytosine-specific restriction protein A